MTNWWLRSLIRVQCSLLSRCLVRTTRRETAEEELLLLDALGEENVTKASVPVATTIITATTITVVPIASLARLKPILWLGPQRLINSYVRTIPSSLFAAPDSFQTGRTDRQCERLADGFDRLG